ncbi:MAG: GNAT family N-acetyltransferase, partial [Clostridiales bacterium]|nr:GNAT family N-acetyltransferase [Clostridiales bacterium]
MVRKFQKSDLELVMEIWLSGNEDAHPFISKEYWKSNFESVQEQLLEAEVYVFEADEVIKGFIGMQGNYIAGIFVGKACR